ncbi:hypothetical protein OS493_007300 [Desmophyllum pertusum]|uniref:Uncharacterized protein n=1 Tax=Desmophyllum pertusum TaxID=174260 RepID=A0A9W9Z3B2_9CNID|nr:hypothetical protein OS493_007300 [Desmophyllum pertusum]
MAPLDILPGYQPWDDSIVARNSFLGTEGGKTKVPTHLSYDEWDCTALFQATIYARSFALPDSKGHHRTLGDLYVKPHKLPHGTFHASVVSSGGNTAETFALAIDQLRLLRNSLATRPALRSTKQHLTNTCSTLKTHLKPLESRQTPLMPSVV